MKKINPILLFLTIIVPLACVAILLVGAIGLGYLYTASAEGSGPSAEEQAALEAEVLAIAADHAATRDAEQAQSQLQSLNLPNAGQYVSFLLDRYIQENRGAEDADTMNLFLLADAMGATTASALAALSTATPLPTTTPPPTATPLPTDTPIPAIPTEVPPTETPVVVVEEEVAPTETPEPTATPEPDTPTPGPPTNTPEPTATPEPTKPAVDFVVAEAYLIPNPIYNACPGSHQIFVTVVDAAGNALDGINVEDTFRSVPPHVTGEKGPGKLEYDLWNNGFSLEVTSNVDGSPVTSEVTPKLSSWDEDIPNEWLLQANYCLDMNECVQRKNSNQLCRGHYSYNVTFQRTY